MQGNELRALEKAFKSTTESNLQRNICLYLQGMKEQRFSKLIQEDTQDFKVEERNLIIGELRIIQKLLNVLEPKLELNVPLANSIPSV